MSVPCSKFDFLRFIKGWVYGSADLVLDCPLQISWQLTLRCNLNCTYCYADSRPDYLEEPLSRASMLAVADEVGASGAIDITLEGGEPLLCPHLLDVMARLKRYPLAIDVLTNGTLLTPELTREMRCILNPRLDSFQVSIDGPDHGSNKHRGKEALEKTLEGIRTLAGAGFHVRTNTVVTQENAEHLPELYQTVRAAGCSGGFALAPVFPVGRGRSVRPPDPETAEAVLARLKELERQHGDLFVSGAPIHRRNPSQDTTRLALARLQRCSGGRGKLAIDPAGNVTPCVFFPTRHFTLGNVLQEPLLAIWRGKPAQDYRHWLMNPSCTSCGDSHGCLGISCIGMAFQQCRRVKSETPLLSLTTVDVQE